MNDARHKAMLEGEARRCADGQPVSEGALEELCGGADELEIWIRMVELGYAVADLLPSHSATDSPEYMEACERVRVRLEAGN